MAKFFSEISDNIILSEIVKDGSYQVELKQPRNVDFLRKYWVMLEFTIYHLPEKFNFQVFLMGVNVADVPINNRDTLHSLFKYLLGVESISFGKMSKSEFQNYYDRSIDVCCKLLGQSKDVILKELINYEKEKRK